MRGDEWTACFGRDQDTGGCRDFIQVCGYRVKCNREVAGAGKVVKLRVNAIHFEL